jgi:probable F420-dependent oxidoreductase
LPNRLRYRAASIRGSAVVAASAVGGATVRGTTLGVLPVFKAGIIADPHHTRAFVRMLEAEGVDSVWAVEHVVVAKDYEPRYPYSASGQMGGAPDTVMPDPLEWLSFVAGATETLRLGTAVVVLPLHSAVVMAKRAATLDGLSGGRFMFGVGSGWQIEEYAACDAPYEARGKRLDDGIAAMRELWQPGFRTHDGPHFSFVDVELKLDVHTPGGPPIVIGGSSAIAARRAGRVGDGFFPYVVSPDELQELVRIVRATAVEHGRDPDAIEVTVWPGSWKPGSSTDPEVLRAFVAAGAHRLVISAQESGATDVATIQAYVRRVHEAMGKI